MADPVLTALCSICHTQTPKYRCPRCRTRTCSLACVQRHKAWASCSGQRDPTVFVERDRLRTEAGVDHDYNFLASIERARESFGRELAERCGGLLQDNSKGGRRGGGGGVDHDAMFEKVWHGDQLYHVPKPPGRHGHMRGRAHNRPGDESRFLSGSEKQVRRRLRTYDIDVIPIPKGLTRQRQNKTAWNRRTNTINWQIEWVVFPPSSLDLHTTDDRPVQIMHKALDEKPLFKAFAGSLDWYKSGIKRARENEERVPEGEYGSPVRKRQRISKRNTSTRNDEISLATNQHYGAAWWQPTECTLQNTLTGEWSETTAMSFAPRTKEERETDLAALQFFLLEPTSSRDHLKHLMPLSSRETLVDALSGRTVVEFPTIYVLGTCMPLPQSFSVSPAVRRPPMSKTELGTEERGTQPSRKGSERRYEGGRSSPITSTQARTGGSEEGEINSEGEQLGTKSSWSRSVSCGNTSGSSSDSEADASNCGDTLRPELSKAAGVLVEYGSSSD